MNEIDFQSINYMKKEISNDDIKNIYSNFDFYYFSTSKYKETNMKKIRKLLRNPLKEFNFFIYSFYEGDLDMINSDNLILEKKPNNSDINNFKVKQESNIAICGEGKCFLFENINIQMIKKILSKSKAIQVNINNSTEIFDNKSQNIDINEEIDSFRRFFSKSGKFDKKFIEFTFSPIAGYLIQRFYYPTTFFKNPNFFHFYSNYRSSDHLFIEKFKEYFESHNFENFMRLDDELIFETVDSNRPEPQIFKESDFIYLKEILIKGFNKFILVIHIKKLHIFLLKKFIGENLDKYQKREIDFCEKYSHRCFIPFYGFVKNEAEIKGLVYEFMPNDTITNFMVQKENKDNQLFSYLTLTRVVQGLKYLQTNSLINRDLKAVNILVNHDNIPYISDIETVRKIYDGNDEPISLILCPSPEYFYGKNISFPTDIYSLGILIYSLFEHKDIEFHYRSEVIRIDEKFEKITKASKNINLLYQSCIKYEQNERIKINGIYNLLSKEIIELIDVNKFISKIDIFEKSTEISQYLFENICILKENSIKTDLKNYFYKFYFTILNKSLISYEFKSVALNNLANLYFLGYFIDRNYNEAKKLYEMAIEYDNNNSHALNNLGELYRFGKGVKRDFTIAKQYFDR